MMTSSQYLTFQSAGATYAIDVLLVREITAPSPMTAVPRAPASICGVVNLRGSVVPVVDLAIKLGRPATLATDRTCIIILDMNGPEEKTTVGVLADSVHHVVEWPPEEIAPAPRFGSEAPVDFLRGLGKEQRSFIPILDIERILSVSDPVQVQPRANDQRGGEIPACESAGQK